MKHVLPDSTNPYKLRNKNPFQTNNVRTVFNGTETLSYRGHKTWALVPEEIRQVNSLIEFKNRIKRWKPVGCTCRLCKVYTVHIR